MQWISSHELMTKVVAGNTGCLAGQVAGGVLPEPVRDQEWMERGGQHMELAGLNNDDRHHGASEKVSGSLALEGCRTDSIIDLQGQIHDQEQSPSWHASSKQSKNGIAIGSKACTLATIEGFTPTRSVRQEHVCPRNFGAPYA